MMAEEIVRNECAHCGEPSGVCMCEKPEWVVARYVRAPDDPPEENPNQERLL